MADPHPFYFLSSAFTYPEYREPRPPVAVLLSLAHDLGLTGLPLETHESFALQQLQAEYVRLFVNAPGGVPAPPYASVYIQGKGILKQQGYEQAMAFYGRAGLEPAETSECEDHIGHELAFIGHLLDHGQFELLDEFVAGHVMAWSPHFFQRLKTADPAYFYLILGQVAELCINHLIQKEGLR